MPVQGGILGFQAWLDKEFLSKGHILCNFQHEENEWLQYRRFWSFHSFRYQKTCCLHSFHTFSSAKCYTIVLRTLVASNGQIMDHSKSYGSPAGLKLIMAGKIHYFTIRICRKWRQLSTKEKTKVHHGMYFSYLRKNSNSLEWMVIFLCR